jgi:hypothetical protein
MLTLFAVSLALVRIGGLRILHEDPRNDGFAWLLAGVALSGVLLWEFPRMARKPELTAG